ncbi:MAG: Nif3-like dinuclear metal center hexameric protein [Prolixibacteraceae bacterium]
MNTPETPKDIVKLIKKKVTCEWSDKTVDTFKAGNPDTKLTGIATCMFADMNVLKEAVKKNCNFIITHEPTFYNHLDETTDLQNDPVFREKMKFIEDNQLVIFRFHDHIHSTEPDGIYKGMIREMGLENCSENGSLSNFTIPKTALKKFTKRLQNKLDIENVRVIGNPEMEFTRLAFSAGAPGGKRHIKTLASPDVEVLIAGEASEWETYLYANDAVQQGKNKAVIFLGHIKSEEAGMKYAAGWLDKFIHGVPVIFIENKPNFKTL